LYPDPPVAAASHRFIRITTLLVDGFPEDDRACIGDGVSTDEITPAFFCARVDVILCPSIGVHVYRPAINGVLFFAALIDDGRIAVRNTDLGIAFQYRNKRFKKLRLSDIVGLGDPNVAALCSPYA